MNIFIKKITMLVNILGTFVLLVGFIFLNEVGSFLKIDSKIVICLMIIICALGYYNPFYAGCMGGFKLFSAMGGYSLLIPFYKITGVILATIVDGDYKRLLICMAVIIPGSIITAIMGKLIVKKHIPCNIKQEKNIVSMPELKQWLNSFILNIGFIIYMNVGARI